jgi:hypothetical protein
MITIGSRFLVTLRLRRRLVCSHDWQLALSDFSESFKRRLT